MVLLKLHKQFGHASVENLKRLLDCAGNNDDDCIAILNDIVSKCGMCIRYSKPKPAVGLPMASTYNETVAVELHELEPGVWVSPCHRLLHTFQCRKYCDNQETQRHSETSHPLLDKCAWTHTGCFVTMVVNLTMKK